MPNPRGLRAATAFGKGAAATSTESVIPQAASATAKVGLRGLLRGVAGGVITDMIFPASTASMDESAMAKAPQHRPTLPLMPAHTPGAVLAPAQPMAAAGVRPAAAKPVSAPVARRGVRTAPTRTIETPQPTVTWDAPAEQPTDFAAIAAQPAEQMGYIESGGVRYYVPGSKEWDGKGGSEEANAENTRLTADQDVQRAAGIRLRLGDSGYAGSQAAWEAGQDDDQERQRMLSTPFPFKTAAALLARRQQRETERMNSLNFDLNAAKTQADVQHLGTEDKQTNMLLPGKVQEQGAGIRFTDAKTALTGQETTNAALTGQTILPLAKSEIALRGDQGFGIRTSADVAKAELPFKQNLYASEAGKNQAFIDSNPTKLEIAQEKNATAIQLAREKAEAPIREAALQAAQTAGVPLETAVAALKAGLKPKKKSLFRDAGFYDAQGNRVDQSKIPGGAPVAIATATDAQGTKWVKYSDGTTAKAQ